MPSLLKTIHLDLTSDDPIERAKIRVTVQHTDPRGIQYDESLIVADGDCLANALAAKRTSWDETDVATVVSIIVAQPVVVRPMKDVVVAESISAIVES